MNDSVAVHIYTDGSSVGGADGPGGWAAVVFSGLNLEVESPKDESPSPDITLSGHEAKTTNQRMEILAAIKGLEAVFDTFDRGALTVYSDSSYLVNCMRRGWHEKWVEAGWVNSRKKPVANRDLWERLLSVVGALASKEVSVEFRKVRGHTQATHARAEGNRLADRLAVDARRSGTKRDLS